MSKWIISFIIVSIVLIFMWGCESRKPQEIVKKESTPLIENAAPTAIASQQVADTGKAGKVLETMNSGGYTYVHVDTGTEKMWIAGPETKVKVGDSVVFPSGMVMTNFHSKTLDRDFEQVLFVGQIKVGGKPPVGMEDVQFPEGHPDISSLTQQMPEGHPDLSTMAKQMPEGHPDVKAEVEAVSGMTDFSGIEKLDGGYSVAEIYAGKGDLAGKEVAFRGKVVKFNPRIMGTNWIHVQDGTGEDGSNDLTVTTSAVVNEGDVIVIRGVLAIDKDFGFNYKYDLIVEDAEVIVEGAPEDSKESKEEGDGAIDNG
jgi:hypothetical protein